MCRPSCGVAAWRPVEKEKSTPCARSPLPEHGRNDGQDAGALYIGRSRVDISRGGGHDVEDVSRSLAAAGAPWRNLRALLPGLGKADRDRLLAAGPLATAPAALQRPALLASHRRCDRPLRLLAVLPCPFAGSPGHDSPP